MNIISMILMYEYYKYDINSVLVGVAVCLGRDILNV